MKSNDALITTDLIFLTLYKKENNHNHLDFRKMMEKRDCHKVWTVFTFTTPRLTCWFWLKV